MLYGTRKSGQDYFVTLRGPFPTDEEGREAFRAKTTGTRYKVMYLPEEDALKRVIGYAIDNLLDTTREDLPVGLISLGIGCYAATDREGGHQASKDLWHVYRIKMAPIIDTNNIALTANLQGFREDEVVTDISRTKDFPR